MKTYFMIFTESHEKIKEILPDYSLNDYGILMKDNKPVETTYELNEILSNNNIAWSRAIKCRDCGDWTTEYYYINSRNGDFYVCSECSDNYFYCYDCEEYYDDSYETFTIHNGEEVCEHCRGDHYVCCHDCGELYHSDDVYYCDDCDEYFCENCWDDHYHQDNLLYDYHEFNDWRLHKTAEEPEPEFYIGHELEIDDGDDMEEAVNIIDNIGGICMHDGSLSDSGIEFISHPLSYNYMLSQENAYRQAFDKLANDCNYKSHNTDTCGLHFHVTRPQNSKVIDRIILFMETYKEEIFTLSRRKTEELNRWSRFLSDKRTSTNPKIIKSLDYIVNNKDTCDRYMALNLTNYKTIEFRFFKGTLKYETFMADFEFVNNLVHFASDLDLPIEEMTWEKVVSVGKFLPQYITEKNLHTDKPIVDYSKEMVIEYNKEKSDIRIQVDNLIAEILKTIANKARTKNNTSQKLRQTTNVIYTYNEQLSNLQNLVYNLENIDIFNYDRLNSIKRDLQYIKERLGK